MLGPAVKEYQRKVCQTVNIFICLFITWALPEEAVDSLQPLSSAFRASVRGAVTLSGSLHGPIGAGGRAGAPAGPLIPHSIH